MNKGRTEDKCKSLCLIFDTILNKALPTAVLSLWSYWKRSLLPTSWLLGLVLPWPWQASITSESPASPLDSSLTHKLPDYASAVWGIICESLKSQSEIIMRLEDNGRRQTVIIHQVSDKVEILSRNQPLPLRGMGVSHETAQACYSAPHPALISASSLDE